MHCSPPGSSVHGIFQARVLEWVASPFSRGSSWPRDWTQVSRTAGRSFAIWAQKPNGRGIQTKGWDIHRGRRSLVVVFLHFHPSCVFPRRRVIFAFSLDQSIMAWWALLIHKADFIIMRALWITGYIWAQEIPTMLCSQDTYRQNTWCRGSGGSYFPLSAVDPHCLEDVWFPAPGSCPISPACLL